MTMPFRPLGSQRVLIVGDFGDYSGDWRLARQASANGSRLALMGARVTPAGRAAAARMDARLLVGDIADRAQLEALVDSAAGHLGGFDRVVHATEWAACASAAHAGDEAIEHALRQLRASCRSFTDLARLCAVRMAPGASLVRLDRLPAAAPPPSSQLMQAVRAVLASIVRYLALELQPWGLAVQGVCVGPMSVPPASAPSAVPLHSMRADCAASVQGMAAHNRADGCMALLSAAAAAGAPGRLRPRHFGAHAR
jgi:enoyl-[acyl-carrier-protein] reductase (NADH)